MRHGQLITDGRTLAGMTRQGFVLWDGPGRTDRHWTGWQARRVFVQPGPKLDAWYQEFRYRGGRYRLTYVDGCWHPFVMWLDVGPDQRVPAFV